MKGQFCKLHCYNYTAAVQGGTLLLTKRQHEWKKYVVLWVWEKPLAVQNTHNGYASVWPAEDNLIFRRPTKESIKAKKILVLNLHLM